MDYREALVKKIWSRSFGRYAFMARKWLGEWIEARALDSMEVAPTNQWTDRLSDLIGSDAYFSALRFEEDLRVAQNVGRPGILFADLDAVRPMDLTVPVPSVAWSTSPDSYQAVWFLSEPIDVPRFEALNRALTEATGADKGGWHVTKVLRIPGTLNWKRRKLVGPHGVIPRGELLWESDPISGHTNVYSPEFMETALGTVEVSHNPNMRGEFPVGLAAANLRLATKIALPLRIRAWLIKETVSDRSMFIWKVALAFHDEGFSRETAMAFMQVAPWNKFKDRPARLWEDINRAYALNGD